jgi:uncharacterized protein (TIGR03435 family)
MTSRINLRRIAAMLAVLSSGVLIAPLTAQTQTTPAPPPNPTFEAASIKPNKSGDAGFCICGPRADRLVNVPLDVIITWAFGVRKDQVLDLPAWAGAERFDIVTKSPDGQSPNMQQTMRMMQSLLADRFNLKFHADNREGPIYALVVARRDGRLGPKLKANTVDCAAYLAEKRAAGQVVVANGLGDAPLCGPMVASDRFVKASAKPIENLANALARQVGRPVIDRTGLTGNFDYNLEWSPDLSATPSPDVSGAPANAGVPLVTALQEQLGLKLDSARGPNQVIVIDRLEHPTPD